ncbi:hypothetical protein [Pantoea sp. FN0307]|uniref:hypothetical protein n=1 Tax=Pantoea sp. FN0307 TaxID=3418560 RepID=UPI003CF33A97
MIRNFILALLVILMQASPVSTASVLSISQYATEYSNVNVLNDDSIKHILKTVLSKDYETFIGNFNVVDRREETADGGLSNIINYKSNQSESDGIQKDIAQWVFQFENMQFQTPSSEAGSANIEYFKTKKFDVKISINCQGEIKCNDAIYYGRRIKDGAELTLKGKVARASCHERHCPILSFIFGNGNTQYILSKIDNSLLVIDDNKIIIDEKGTWNKNIHKVSFDNSFNGRWSGEVSGKDNQNPESTMSLWLKENNGIVTGQYCLIYNYGKRIDCTDDDEINIAGYVIGENRAIINFDTWFNEKGGKAEISLQGNKAIWKLLKRPTNNQYYLPDSYEYTRE